MARRSRRRKESGGGKGRWPDAKRLVRGAARDLKKALDDLWPTRDHRSEPERNLVFWVARRLSHKGFRPLFEVNFLGRKASRLDLVAIKKGRGTAFVLLCEAKNLWNGSGAANAAKDIKRLRKFGLGRHDLPRSRARCLLLLSVWREEVRDWWLQRPHRSPHPQRHAPPPGWRRLRWQIQRTGMHLSAVPGGEFEEEDGSTTTRWVLIATWRRPRR